MLISVHIQKHNINKFPKTIYAIVFSPAIKTRVNQKVGYSRNVHTYYKENLFPSSSKKKIIMIRETLALGPVDCPL